MNTLNKHSWLAWTLLMCGLLATVMVSLQVKRGIEADTQRQFAFNCDQVTLKIYERLAAYGLILRSSAGLFAASETVERREWRAYVETLHASKVLLGLQGIGFAQVITPEQLTAHLARIRAEGFPDYRVWPAGERAIYTSIIYLEPFGDRNRRAFGYDMFSEPVRRAAMEQARDTDEAALSGKVVLVQETDTGVQAGTLMYFPVYRNGWPVATLDQRRAALLGWVYSAYRMTDLLTGILGDWAHQQGQTMHLHIYDGAQATPETLLFCNHSPALIHPPPQFQQKRTLDFNGKQWLLAFSQNVDVPGMNDVWAVLIAGSALSILLFGLLLSLMRTRASIRLTRALNEKVWRREQALKESEFRWRFALEGAGDGVMDWNLQNGKVFYSHRWKKMLGFDQDKIGDSLAEWESRIHPADQAQTWATVQAYFDGHTSNYIHEYRIACKDESWRCVLARGMVVNRDPTGQPLRMIVTQTDITERRRTIEQLQLAASVFTHAREGIMITKTDGTIIDVNAAFTNITSYHRDEVIGRNPRILKSNRQDAAFYAAMWRTLIDEGQWTGEIWNRRKGGEVYAQMQTISAVRDAQGVIQHYVSLFSDITALKEHQRQLEHIAHYDALTSLPNRVLLAYRLQQAMAQTKRRQQGLAVAYLDLDGFKAINDSYGHNAGDYLLMAVAARMKQNLRECDTLARLGGDEFVAVLVDLEKNASSFPMLNRLLRAAAQPVRFDTLSLQVSASVGVTFYPQRNDIDADQLLRQADQAMYQAKLAGKNRYHCFDVQQPSVLQDDRDNLAQIQHALTEHELVLHYQPQVNMCNGAVIGATAQLQWQHPQRGLLALPTVLPLLEHHPLAIALNAWVIDAILAQHDAWRQQQIAIPININFGVSPLLQQQLIPHLRAQLQTYPQIAPNQLRLEITEAQALDNLAHTADLIEVCRYIGIGCTLDDFGAGYSALTYLKRLTVPLLKINLIHLANILDDSEDLAILNSMIGLAEAFNRRVIVAGVQSREQGKLLLQLGCALAQGDCIASAMSGDAFAGWVKHWQPPPNWLNQQPLNRETLPLLFASVGHRAWMRALDAALQQQSELTLPADLQECHFGRWLDGEGATCYGGSPIFQAMILTHRQLHAAAQNLFQHHHRARAPSRDRLHRLQAQLLIQIQQLLKESR